MPIASRASSTTSGVSALYGCAEAEGGLSGESRCTRLLCDTGARGVGNRGSAKNAVHEPLAIVGSEPVIAIDPYDLALRVLRDVVVASHVPSIPPSRLDALGAFAKDPRLT